MRTLPSLASFAEKSNCTAAKIKLERLWDFSLVYDQTFRSTRVHQAKQKNEGRRQTYNSQPQKKILADAAVRTLPSLASFAEKSNCTAAKIKLE